MDWFWITRPDVDYAEVHDTKPDPCDDLIHVEEFDPPGVRSRLARCLVESRGMRRELKRAEGVLKSIADLNLHKHGIRPISMARYYFKDLKA